MLKKDENIVGDPSEIVSIHFGKKHFGQYTILLEIQKLVREGQLIRIR